MVFSALLQVSTVIVAVLTLVWHQTRTVERLRKEVRSDHNRLLKLHAKSTRQARKDNDRLRAEFTASHDKLWDAITGNSRKLDRIEGFLGIGMPPPAADRAPGAALRYSPPADSPAPTLEDPPDKPGPGEPQTEDDPDG